jgi:hypothetical protein
VRFLALCLDRGREQNPAPEEDRETSKKLPKKVIAAPLILTPIRDGRAGERHLSYFFVPTIVTLCAGSGELVDLRPDHVRGPDSTAAYTRFFATLALFELFLIASDFGRPFSRFGATIMMGFGKPKRQPGRLDSLGPRWSRSLAVGPFPFGHLRKHSPGQETYFTLVI